MNKKVLKKHLEMFLESDQLKSGCIASTRASWEGHRYSVELLEDTNHPYLLLSDKSIGNMYQTPGVLLRLPDIGSTEEYQECVMENNISEDDYLSSSFYNELEQIKETLREKFEWNFRSY